MRLILAMVRHEINTFFPIPTRLRAFGPKSDEQAISVYRGTNYPLVAYTDIAEREGIKYVVPLVANASPSAAVDKGAFDEMADAICGTVRKSCDGVMLDLHGAMGPLCTMTEKATCCVLSTSSRRTCRYLD